MILYLVQNVKAFCTKCISQGIEVEIINLVLIFLFKFLFVILTKDFAKPIN